MKMAANRVLAADKHSEKYASLMIPIRDLAKNWNVDVASLLEDYLLELGYVKISFEDDPNSDSMNFAEAAMLIQNSACVYSKKVDYLFNLVMQLLEHLKCKSANLSGSKKRVVIKNVKPDDDFPSYDNIELDKNLRLKESDSDPVDINAFTITRMPRQFLSFVHDDDTSLPLYNSKKLLIGNRHDFKINCWQSPFYKSICKEISSLSVANDFPTQAEDQRVETNGFHNEAAEDAVEEPCPNLAGDEGADDFGFDNDPSVHSDVENGQDEPVTPARPPEVQKNGLAMAAEKALREWDPLYAHENIKQRLRPVRKGRTLSKTDYIVKNSRTPKRAVKSRTVADFCNKKLCSRASQLPKRMADEIEMAESAVDMFSKELKRKTDLKNKTGENDLNGESDDRNADKDAGNDYSDDDNDDDHGMDNHSISSMEDAGINPKERGELNCTFDIVSQQTDQFLREASERGQLTESERIKKKWEEYLSDKLEDEEKYVSYNVREYSTKVLSKFSSTNAKQTLSFSQIANGNIHKGMCQDYSLLLFRIQQDKIESVNLEDVDVTLLSRKQNFEQFDNEVS